MIRIVVALLSLAVLGAIFAGIYYSRDNLELREEGAPAFQLAPGEAKQTLLQATVPGTPIVVSARVFGPIDIYVLDKEWSRTLPAGGALRLDHPFSYHAESSRIGANGTVDITLVSDGKTETLLIFDNSDNYYANDTVPDAAAAGRGIATVQMTVRYLEEEKRTLTLGYIAAVPSVLLVLLTIGRKAWRWQRERVHGRLR